MIKERKFYLPEVAELLNVKYMTLYDAILAGKIPEPPHMSGRRRYYLQSEVDQILKSKVKLTQLS